MSDFSIQNKRALPLVSVVVVTYNSAKFVLETLESIKNQSYRNIELIISDDASTDRTTNICRAWVDQNKDRFLDVQIVASKENTGISPNCNRGLHLCKGEWIKFIAGDDTLEKNCIYDYVQFVSRRDILVAHSEMNQYQNYFQEEHKIGCQSVAQHIFNSGDITAKMQYEYLLRTNIISAPTVIFHSSIFQHVGQFDEEIPMIEDYPMWLKITRAGIKFHFLNARTVNYRWHSNSESAKNHTLFSNSDKYLLDVRKKYINSNIGWMERVLFYADLCRKRMLNMLVNKISHKAISRINDATSKPFLWYKRKILEKIGGE